jgi:hypothetical protein
VRDLKDGFWIGWLDLLTPYTQYSELQAITALSLFPHFTVHRYTRTRVLSLHQTYPGNGFITVSLYLQITHGVFFSQPNSFLATAYLIQILCSQAHILVVWYSKHNSILCCSCQSESESESESESYVTTDGQPASLSWNKATIWGLRPDFYYLCDSYGLVLVGRPLWREVGSVFCMCFWPLPAQSFSGPSPWDLRPYFTVSDLRLLFSSLPMTRRGTVEVFDPASTRVCSCQLRNSSYNHFARTTQKTQPLYCWECVFTAPLHSNGSYWIVLYVFVAAGMCLRSRCLAMRSILTLLFRLSGAVSRYELNLSFSGRTRSDNCSEDGDELSFYIKDR